MKFIEKKTKMIATIGPSSETTEVLKQLIINGVTAIRTNFSHGTYEEQGAKMDKAREVAKELNIPISAILDTKGPEIRVGIMKDGKQEIHADTEIKILTGKENFEKIIGTSKSFAVSYSMEKDVKTGDSILFDDGKLTTYVTKVEKGLVFVKTVNSHVVKSNKRINLPGIDFSLPFLSEKDKKDLIFGIKKGIDYVAASFVNSAKNVRELRKILDNNGGKIVQIISKIESTLGIQNIDEIIRESDGIMIARGDLGLEIPFENVPFYQKEIIRKCRNVGKPVIVATQMLDSMESTPQPTRAEVTDVYWATELGADATMLSGESANGLFPVEAVKVMSKINQRAEKEFYNKLYYPVQLQNLIMYSENTDRVKIAQAVALKLMNGDYRYAIVYSKTGELLKEVARFRPNANIIGLLRDKSLINAFGITSNVFISIDSPELYENSKSGFEKGDPTSAREILKPYFPKQGDKFIVVDAHAIKGFQY